MPREENGDDALWQMVDESTVRFKSNGPPLRGTVAMPGDKSISHRSLILGALASGVTTVRGLSRGEDVACTRWAMAVLGVQITEHPLDSGDTQLTIASGGRSELREPADVLDVGNSGTSARLLAGVASSLEFLSVITGDASLRSRPMDRVIEPLAQMGAAIDARQGATRAPMAIRGGGLKGINYVSPVASAQVKSAVLLAALGAVGKTSFREPVLTRTHTEEMLRACGVDVETVVHKDGSATHSLEPAELVPFQLDIPGDPSQAAFWMVAAAVTPNSDLTIKNIYRGVGRGGLVDVLKRMGASIELQPTSFGGSDIRVRHSELSATDVGGLEVASLIDELPVFAVAAAMADGTSTVRDAGELRVKESDRIATTAGLLRAMGVSCEEHSDGFTVRGSAGRPLVGARIDAGLDHRIAMTAAVGSLVASSEVEVGGWRAVASSYPSFLEDLTTLRSQS